MMHATCYNICISNSEQMLLDRNGSISRASAVIQLEVKPALNCLIYIKIAGPMQEALLQRLDAAA